MTEAQMKELREWIAGAVRGIGAVTDVDIVEGDILVSTPEYDFALIIEPA